VPQSDQNPSLASAIALVVLGLLILVPSGLCTGVFAFGPIVAAILNPGRYPNGNSTSNLALAFIFGGPFIVAGGALLFAGIRRFKARKSVAEDPKRPG
jgi:hypothetical protein